MSWEQLPVQQGTMWLFLLMHRRANPAVTTCNDELFLSGAGQEPNKHFP